MIYSALYDLIGKRTVEGSALPLSSFRPKPPLMQIDHLANNGQPDPRTFKLLR